MKCFIPGFISTLTKEQKIRIKTLLKSGAKIAYWRSDKEGRPANGGDADPVRVGSVQKVSGPLSLCSAGTLHATYMPSKWKGDRVWLVAMIGKIVEQDDKMGALEREILAEITQKGNQ